MKRKKFIKLQIHILLTVCAALGWWGMLYPELAMTPDTVRIINEEGIAMEAGSEEWDFDSELYWQILKAEPGQVRFKSRLLSYLEDVWLRISL